MKQNAGVVFLQVNIKAKDMNIVFFYQALPDLFKHPGIIYGFKYRGEDYSPFFYFLHADLNLR